MKKLLKSDKKIRLKIQTTDKKHFILNSIFKNLNFLSIIRLSAFLKLQRLSSQSYKVSTVNRCIYTINKKRFNKLTLFSRHVFLKLIRNGQIHGVQKSSW